MGVLKNKYDFVFFVQAKNCNYNGDPDFANMPRIDEETNYGIMTDVCIKRNIRDYVTAKYNGEFGEDIFVADGINVNKQIAECIAAVSADKHDIKKGKNVDDARNYACKKFFDVRTFGGVLSTGLNAGQVRGPVQIEMASSIDKVNTDNITITRLCYTNGSYTDIDEYDKKDAAMDPDKKRTMGNKTFAPYALFEVHGYVSAALAQKTGFSDDDLNLLFESILNMYNFRSSTSKAGMSVIGPVVIFKHEGVSLESNPEQRDREAILGCASAYKLHKLISVCKKADVEFPRNYTDYNATIDLAHVPAGIRVGFKNSPFENVVWDKMDDGDEWLGTK